MAITFDPASALLGIGGIASNLFSNSQNQENFERQMDFAKYQYEDTKKYNSMQEQVKRMRAAGMNPALMSGSLQTGMQSSVSQPSPNPYNPLDLSGLSSIANSIRLNDAQASNLAANTDKQKTESDLNRVDLRTRFIEKLSSIDNMLEDTKLKSSQREYLNNQREFLKKQIKFADERMEWENHNLRLEAENKRLNNQALVIQNKYLPMFNEQQIKSLISSMALNYAAAGEHKANAKKIAQETISECIRSGILGNDFFKTLPEGIKGERYANALRNNSTFRKIETTLEHVVYPMLNNGPSLFIPLK